MSVGGTPQTVAEAGAVLRRAATACDTAAPAVDGAANADAGDPALAAALARFAAAAGAHCRARATEFDALAMLALHSAQDLAAAGGSGPVSV